MAPDICTSTIDVAVAVNTNTGTMHSPKHRSPPARREANSPKEKYNVIIFYVLEIISLLPCASRCCAGVHCICFWNKLLNRFEWEYSPGLLQNLWHRCFELCFFWSIELYCFGNKWKIYCCWCHYIVLAMSLRMSWWKSFQFFLVCPSSIHQSHLHWSRCFGLWTFEKNDSPATRWHSSLAFRHFKCLHYSIHSERLSRSTMNLRLQIKTHYSFQASCWASGYFIGNKHFVRDEFVEFPNDVM